MRETGHRTTTPPKSLWPHERTGRCPEGAWKGRRSLRGPPLGPDQQVGLRCFLLLLLASFISPEKSRKMLPTPSGTHSGTSLLGPSLLDGNSRDSFVSRSLADVAEVGVGP